MDVVILVDCWDGQLGKINLRSEMYANIDRAIKDIDPELIVLASYASSEYYDPELRNNVWFRNFWNEFPDFVEHRRWFYRTHQTILKARYNGYQIFLTKISQFDQVLARKKIQPSRIWYFGNHWNSCLMQQEIGFKNMQIFCKMKFGHTVPILFREDCMLYRPCVGGVHANQEIYPDVASDQITSCTSLGNGVWQLRKFVDIFG